MIVTHKFFNAHHSPIGAFASLTLGEKGAKGGYGLELGKPADQALYFGVEVAPDEFQFLPFFESASDLDDRARYEVGAQLDEADADGPRLLHFADDQIQRDYRVASDRWTAPDLELTVTSPVMSVPDPAGATDDALKLALLPAVIVTLTVDNRQGTLVRRAVLGFEDNALDSATSALRRLDDTSGGQFVGIGQGRTLAIVTKDEGVASGRGFAMGDILLQELPENLTFGLGRAAALIATVPAGEQRTFTFAACFYRGGIVTAGMDASYYYTKYWNNIEEVAAFALDNVAPLADAAAAADARVEQSSLSPDQKFMLAHAVRSYYGSTELLQGVDGQPIWIVNEGEYRMMNTLDLTADQVFFEMAMNPWTVRNELDHFASRYSYTDQVAFPGEPDALYPGGISFTHDMGVTNVFSRPGYSTYEKYGLHGCFSHMTHEELVNWLCCALVYGNHDPMWLLANGDLIENCFTSMLNRDNPDPALRNGLMSLDSSRCMGGAEITTYDSLDVSLGQSRGNVYMASKCWAAYVGLERAFGLIGREDLAAQAARQASLCADTVAAAVESDETLPAVIGEGVEARIIPAIEGLIFPALMGVPDATATDGAYAQYVATLKRHLIGVLKPGVCLFPYGAWKLSSTSDNSWLSKIYLCQHVARAILGIDGDHVTATADAAHAAWLLDPQNTYFAWSDQIIAGVAGGSRYYPRGVTAWLWLD